MERQEFIDQIKRIAVESGGVPPGLDKFVNETGLKKHEFLRFWPRWGDAVREAELAPNQLRAAFSEEFLIEKIIGLAREIGHFPVLAELTTKAYSDKGFPNTSTFQNRLGSKSQMVLKVLQLCSEKPDFKDIVDMCKAAMKSDKKSSVALAELGDPKEGGMVYLIKAGRFYKIGKTKSMGRREYDLAIQLAEKPTTIHVIKTDDPDGIEVYWHRRFAEKRKNGEWFDLSPADIKAFKKWIRIA